MTISVLIPTYKRPDDLRRCLAALREQDQRPDQVVVARRVSDTMSRRVIRMFADGWDAITEVVVGPSDNLVCSMNAALAATRGDLVALTDDDTEPPRDWIDRVAASFSDPDVGAVGGRDIQVTQPGEARVVGRLQWFGRIVGNHHLGVGPKRDVDVLKGANFCVRGDLLRSIGFDDRLRGAGNVSHWELALSFEITRRGYRLVYDPDLTVVHHVADRHDGDANNRGGFNGPALRDSVHNETLAVLEHLPPLRRAAYLGWAHAIGTGDCPGMLQVPRIIFRSGRPGETIARWRHTQAGRAAGLIAFAGRRAEQDCQMISGVGGSHGS